MIPCISMRFFSISSLKSKIHTLTDPNLLSLLNQCSTFKHMNQTHAFMVSRGLDQDNIHLSKFIEACALLGFKDYALSIFTHKTQPDIYIYNTMIKGLSQMDSAKDAVLLFNRIQVADFRPDTYSFPFVLKAVVQLSTLEVGKEIHSQVIQIGLASEIHVLTGLIQMYSACGAIADARKLFDRMHQRDVVSWNAMVAGYAKIGDVENARMLFERMPERNVISWTAVIAGYAQMNRSNEAIAIFRRMQLTDIEPDEISMLAVLSACAHLGALELGEWIHNYIDKHQLHKIVPLINALIGMYAKSGKIEKAVEVFENMKHRSVITWTTMIAGLALHGLGVEALEMFSRMERARIKPNDVTFIAILSACSHVGLVDAGRWYFEIMSSRYQLAPKIEHYGCMVDLLARAGYLQEAQDLVREMPFEANGAIWGALLAASRIHGNVELGERALRHLIEVEPHNSGNYTLLSNIYAAHEKWNDVGKLRKLMRDRGVKKMPGGSSIEVNGTVHEFIVGDDSNSEFKRIYEVLYEINRQLKIAGYVPKICGGPLDFDEG
ncbi:pentatricopeptide repeat-containing protein At5g56310-like [Magnolia sinica]|uniref:pentatricopeptide repeat-containing protein At5g56310-like n=1 Tax=Magnolia sinica TaxID=86752 RepID=UPI002659A1FC|nr:pentatricopeptide repeat-containing protein At5g56310-like [Magnolia sinica]